MLTIIRGIPGTGKSTLAKHLMLLTPGTIHLEADMYHYIKDGTYSYNKAGLCKAHNWCKGSCQIFLASGHDVIVSNTFTSIWQMEPYFKMAKKYGHNVMVRTMTREYGSIHNVPEESMKSMRDGWEPFPGEIFHNRV